MEFLNAFLSYGVVLAIFVIVGAAAIFLGITLRRKKNKEEAQNPSEQSNEKENNSKE